MSPHHLIAENKQAGWSHEIIEKFTAGIKLTGPEVKAVKLGHLSLRGAYVTVKTFRGRAEIWLRALHISPYLPATGAQPGYVPTRDRKLLLQRREISRLIGLIKGEGLTVMPIKVYIERSLIKVEIAVAKQRHKQDKRELIKQREASRQIKRFLQR